MAFRVQYISAYAMIILSGNLIWEEGYFKLAFLALFIPSKNFCGTKLLALFRVSLMSSELVLKMELPQSR
jgi:hypothetical protein